MRLEIADQKLDHGQGQRREHGQPPEQFYLLTRGGHGLVEPHETPDVDQGQDRQAGAHDGQRAADTEGMQQQRGGSGR